MKELNNKFPKRLPKCLIWLYLPYPTAISFKELKKFSSNFNIHSVVVRGLVRERPLVKDPDSNIFKTDFIDYKLYYEYLKNIDKLLKNIDLSLIGDDNDRDKRLFCILANRIVENITYDLEAESHYNAQDFKKKISF